MSRPAGPVETGDLPEENARGGWVRSLAGVIERRETVRYLVVSNLRAGHRNKILGNLWSLLDPLLFLGVYFVVFGLGLRQAAASPGEFLIYLSIGVLVHRFVDGVVSQAATVVQAHRGLLHEVSFPRAILPVALTFSRLFDFLWALFVLLCILIASGSELTWHVGWLPMLIAIEVIFAMGLALWVAYFGAFFADTANIVAVALRLSFFLSPIFYFARSEHGHIGIVPEHLLGYYMLNPLAGFLDLYRDVLLWGRAPDPTTLAYVSIVAIATWLSGFALFSRGEGSFAKYA